MTSFRTGLLAAIMYIGLFGYWANMLIPKQEIVADLAPYYKSFLSAVQYNCYAEEYNNPNQIIVQFANLPDDEIGLCTRNLFGYKIEIDKKSWDTFDEGYKYEVMFHESIHCLLKRDHVDNPDNIMYPYLRPFPMFKVFYQAEQYIKSDCTMWKKNESSKFRPIEN